MFIKKVICIALAVSMIFAFSACDNTVKEENDGMTAKCLNGQFIGSLEEDTGVLSFKGIPYAKQPVGELRWKAPAEPDNSDETFEAKEFGKSSIQYYWHSEAITTDVGEDCLTLNVWTNDLETDGKAVMVFFHGGAFAWGGTSEPIYNAQYIVDANPDVIVVTCNYRVGIMGFANFNGIPGSENFPDSQNLGILDCMMALKWIKNNIASFGGDCNNVTVFGESAGAGIISCLLATECAGELFQRAIIESGAPNQTLTTEESDNYTYNVDILMEVTGSESMDDLMALTEEQLIEANEYPIDVAESCLNDYYSLPVRGTNLMPEDIYEAIRLGSAKNVDVMIGTNLDEINYWVAEMCDLDLSEYTEEEINEIVDLYSEYFIGTSLESNLEELSEDESKLLDNYLELYSDMDELWATSRMLGDLYFRAPSILVAESHSESLGTGKTYMYLFEKENTEYDVLGACHAVELAYVFRNFKGDGFSGEVNQDLADKVCSAWTNFAKTGDPGFGWSEYDKENRNTMIFGNDNTLKVESDPYSKERELLSPLVKYGLLPVGA